MVVRKRQNVSIIFRKASFQHSLHILNLQVCVHSTNDLTNKQTKKRLYRKERDEEGRKKRKGEKVCSDRESTFGWRNDSEEGNESGWAIYIFVLKTKRQIKLITALKKQNRIWGTQIIKPRLKVMKNAEKKRTREEKWWIMCL